MTDHDERVRIIQGSPLDGRLHEIEGRLSALEAQDQKPMDLIIAEAIFGRERLKELGIS